MIKKVLIITSIIGILTPSVSFAIIQTNITSGQMPGAATSFVTSSTAPSSDKLYLLFLSSTGAPANETPTVTGNDMTWVKVGSVTNAGGDLSTVVFRAMNNTSSPSVGAITVNFGASQSRAAWTLDEFSNVALTGSNGSGAIVQSSTAQVAGITLVSSTVLNAFAQAVNGAYGVITAQTEDADPISIAPGSSFTEIIDQDLKSPPADIRMQNEYLNRATTSVNWTITNTGNQWNGSVMAFEIAHASATVATAARGKKRMTAIFDD